MILLTIVLCWVLIPEKKITNGLVLIVSAAQGPQGCQWQDLKRSAGVPFTEPLFHRMGSFPGVPSNDWTACTRELMVNLQDRNTFYVYTSIHAP